MKNLELLRLFYTEPSTTFAENQKLIQTPETVYFTQDGSLYAYKFSENSTDELMPLPSDIDEILCLKFLNFESKICIVNGPQIDFIKIPIESDNEFWKRVSFDENIIAIRWNPTEEVVAIVFASGITCTYAIDYESADTYLQGQSTVDAAVPDTVYVGWGSKDTQFQGAEGKKKAKQDVPVQVAPIEDRNPLISWRGNGEMFVINYWHDFKRLFTVFETPCKAVYRSEECPGMLPCVAWRPAGNMIATVTEICGKNGVVIFEKNGQKRFDFDLDFGQVTVTEIKWSPCAHILSLRTKSPVNNTESIHVLTSSNYKWYEKQKLEFSTENPLIDFEWLESAQFTYTLQVVTKLNVVKYVFRSAIHENKVGLCGVICGRDLQLTDFKQAVIPPVLSTSTLTADNSINFIVFLDDWVGTVDSNGTLTVYDKLVKKFDINLTELDPQKPNIPLAQHNFRLRKSTDYLMEFFSSRPYPAPSAVYDLNLTSRTLLPAQSPSDLSEFNENTLYVAFSSGSGFECALDARGIFTLDGVKVLEAINSFVLTESYLLATSKLNELYCVRVTKRGLESLRKSPHEIFRRNVEQGSSIVTAIPDTSQVVLQMPRGNLETISCRLISIDILDRMLQLGRWQDAIYYIRTEKLNANLLIDLDYDRFLHNIPQFISACGTNNQLNNICLEIEDGNVLTTIYKYWDDGERVLKQKKTTEVFQEILNYFDQIDYSSFISTIMIISFHYFTLEQALSYVQDLLKRSKDEPSLNKLVNSAINTLRTYGCPEVKLYHESLLLYDLDLACAVAGCCQMDPRLYEPQLKELESFTEVERRFEINLLAKRPKVAVAYLLRCHQLTLDDLENFLHKNNVNREAYAACPVDSRHFKTVSKAFGRDLATRGRHSEAGLILKRAGLLENALEEFIKGLKWRDAIDLMNELQYKDVNKMAIIDKMATDLVANGKMADAAILYEQYAKDYEKAIGVLLGDYKYAEAVHLANQHKDKNFMVSHVIPALKKHRNNLSECLKDMANTFEQHRTRLAEVRKSRAAKSGNNPHMPYSHEDDRHNDIDLFSDAGSVTTRSSRSARSRSSTASSRNRRKEERKKHDLRVGGVYEDIALIRSIHILMKEIYAKSREVRDCCTYMLQEGAARYEEAKELYDQYAHIEGVVSRATGEIWPPHYFLGNITQDIRERADLENLEHLDLEYRTRPERPINWTLDLFETH